jgi:hypothetical protein
MDNRSHNNQPGVVMPSEGGIKDKGRCLIIDEKLKATLQMAFLNGLLIHGNISMVTRKKTLESQGMGNIAEELQENGRRGSDE